MLQSREAGCFWCPPSFPFPYSAHSIAYKPHISQYPIPSTQLKLSPYVLTHPYLTPSHQDMFASTPPYPIVPFHPTQTPPVPSYPIPPQSILTPSYLAHPILPVNLLNALSPTLSTPPQTTVFTQPYPLPLHHPAQSTPIHSISHPNTAQPLLILPQLTPSCVISIHLKLSYFSNSKPRYSITFPPLPCPALSKLSSMITYRAKTILRVT